MVYLRNEGRELGFEDEDDALGFSIIWVMDLHAAILGMHPGTTTTKRSALTRALSHPMAEGEPFCRLGSVSFLLVFWILPEN